MADKVREEQKLEKSIKSKSEPIYSLSSVFPFDFFPDTIIIYREKIDIIYRHGFFARHIEPILYKNMWNATIQTSILFASLEIEVSGLINMSQHPEPVSYLKKREAERARELITGLIAANQEGIDLNKFTDKELLEKLRKIGSIPQEARKP